MSKKIINILFLSVIILVIYSIKPVKADSNLIYDVVLFWGQSNMVGYAGIKEPEKQRDTRYDYTDNNSIKRFASETQISPMLLQNSTQMNYTKINQTSQTAYEYLYESNTLKELDSSTNIVGEKLKYDVNTKTMLSNQTPASLEKSYGTNMIPQFCKQYYEKTGHGVIVIFAANGGEKIENFLPSDNPNYGDSKEDKHLYESMTLKYNSAIKYLENNNYNIGSKLYVVFQGETNTKVQNKITDEEAENVKRNYIENYKTIHEKLKEDTGIEKGAIVLTSGVPGLSSWYKGIEIINEAQQKLINENDDIILGSSFAFDNYIPNENEYNNDTYVNSKYTDANGNKLDWYTAVKYARGSVCYNENPTYNNDIHFTSAALSQIGNDVANALSQKDDYYYNNSEYKKTMPSCPDPFIFYNEKDGYYYLFHTNILGYIYTNNILYYYKSKDLKNWEKCSTKVNPMEENGIYVKDKNGKEITDSKGNKIRKRINFWAPEVYKHNNKIYIFYSSFQLKNENEIIDSAVNGVSTIAPIRQSYISVLVGDTFESTFKEENSKLFEFKNSVIDANVLFDDDGKIYLYFVEDQVVRENERSSWIYGVQLNNELNNTVGEPVVLLNATLNWEKKTGNRYWTEGPCVIKNDGKYYMMYSANGYMSNYYSVGYAVSKSPLGEYDKNDNGDKTSTENLLLVTDGKTVFGPGHNNVFYTSDGSLYTVYHVLNKNVASESYTSRSLAFDKIIFKDEKIYINGSTTGIQPIPTGINSYSTVDTNKISITAGVNTECLKNGINNYSRLSKENCTLNNKLKENEYDVECKFNTAQDIKYVWLYPAYNATNDNLPISADILINNNISIKDINLNLLENSKKPALIDLNNLNLEKGIDNIKIAFKGSQSTSLSEITFENKKDTTPPIAPQILAKLENSSGNIYENGSWTNKKIYVELSSNDMSGISKYEWKEGEDGEWKTDFLTNTDGIGKITFGNDRDSTIYFRAIDAAGNVSETSSIIIRKDTAVPTLSSINVISPKSGTYKEGQTIKIESTYSENIYGDENKSEIISNTAPILKLKFGSGIEKIAKFSGVNGNKITYTYQIESGDKGELKTTNYSGNVYDEAGNILTVVNQNIGGNSIIADAIKSGSSNDSGIQDPSNETTEDDKNENENTNKQPTDKIENKKYPAEKESNINKKQNKDVLSATILPRAGKTTIITSILIFSVLAVVFYYKYKKYEE